MKLHGGIETVQNFEEFSDEEIGSIELTKQHVKRLHRAYKFIEVLEGGGDNVAGAIIDVQKKQERLVNANKNGPEEIDILDGMYAIVNAGPTQASLKLDFLEACEKFIEKREEETKIAEERGSVRMELSTALITRLIAEQALEELHELAEGKDPSQPSD